MPIQLYRIAKKICLEWTTIAKLIGAIWKHASTEHQTGKQYRSQTKHDIAKIQDAICSKDNIVPFAILFALIFQHEFGFKKFAVCTKQIFDQ